MGEEALIARTQIVQPSFPVWRINDAILRAPTVAHIQDFAGLTIAG